MRRGRVTPLDNDEALTVCERIKAKYPDILERQADGLYRHQFGSEEMREVLFDYLACQRVADAYRTKRGGRDADHERLRKALERS
jgi:hypothetical protein